MRVPGVRHVWRCWRTQGSLRALRTSYLDLYLLHAPMFAGSTPTEIRYMPMCNRQRAVCNVQQATCNRTACNRRRKNMKGGRGQRQHRKMQHVRMPRRSRLDCWRALIELKARGVVREIGVRP